MKYALFISFIICFNISLLAQLGEQRIYSVYYDVNEKEVNDQNKFLLDSLLKCTAFEKIELVGFADSVGSYEYNLKLSKARAENIRKVIRTSIPTAKVHVNYKGEISSHEDNKSSRRVDVILFLPDLTSDGKYPFNPNAVVQVTEENETGKHKELPKKVNKPVVQKKEPTEEEVFLERIKGKDIFAFENVLFEPGKDTFRHGKIPNELYYLAYYLEDHPWAKVEIHGHVCCVDDKKLSKARAKKVVDFLVVYGIKNNRLKPIGFSNTKPLVEELTSEDQAKNRRVEVKLINKK